MESIFNIYQNVIKAKGPMQFKCPNKEIGCCYSLSDQELMKILGNDNYKEYMNIYSVREIIY